MAPFPQNLTVPGASVGTLLSPAYTGFMTFKSLGLDTALQLISSDSRVHVLSTPFVEVEDGKSASMSVGTSQPYISSQMNQVIGGVGLSNGLGSVVGSSVSFLQTAVSLMVTPQIASNGDVGLVVQQTANDAGGSVVLAGNPVPIQNTRTVTSTLVVSPGDLVGLGGLVQETISTNTTSVPFLGSLPWVGKAFRQEQRSVQRSELVVLLEARVTRKAEKVDGTEVRWK